MRVFIAGATGVYGRALIPRLLARGDEVVALARSVDHAQAIALPGVELVAGDLLHEDPERLRRAMAGCDAAAHLATAIRPGATGSDGANTTAALRIDGTRRLLDAVIAAGVGRYVQQSIVMAYPDGGDRWLDEDTPFDQGEERAPTAHPVVTMEAMVRALDPGRVAWTILRGGSFVGPGTAQDAVIERLRAGTQTVPGDGRNWVSFIHVEDIAEATLLALHQAKGGSVLNITDEPIRNGDYLDRLAALLGVPEPARDPAASRPRSFRCSNAAAQATLGWTPTHGIWPAVAGR
ncbi:MAG: NAD(P)-dependent oxidoreductase [Dehalococcoidia bacterium]|nr:MAG: NAD(P)-dependent oxidoreductase [Dehalococcoidia bacterium]